MPNDHIERQMSFIIEQQAKFTVDIQKLEEAQARTTVEIEKLKESQAHTDGMLRNLIGVSLSLANHMEASDKRLAKLGEETDRRFRELADSQASTDRRLAALIEAVDKLTRRNGGGTR